MFYTRKTSRKVCYVTSYFMLVKSYYHLIIIWHNLTFLSEFRPPPSFIFRWWIYESFLDFALWLLSIQNAVHLSEVPKKLFTNYFVGKSNFSNPGRDACSNRLFISLSVLFSEPSNSRGCTPAIYSAGLIEYVYEHWYEHI